MMCCNAGVRDELLDHVVRIDHQEAVYEYDVISERRSVRVALGHPQAGTDWITVAFKFMCKNSCISGMNRRPVEVIFTLEDSRYVCVYIPSSLSLIHLTYISSPQFCYILTFTFFLSSKFCSYLTKHFNLSFHMYRSSLLPLY
jgi:hypothetical protein